MINPFSTTFGLEPSNYIQRIDESKRIIEEFTSEQPSNYVFLITGVRGSGKTVLLSSVSSALSKRDDWIVVDPGPKDNLLEDIAAELYESGKMKHIFLKSEFSFSFQGIGFSLKGDTPVSSTMTLLKKMLDHVKKKSKRVLITIDEVDNSNQMKSFIQAYQSLIRQGYPVMLLMTGLYENVSKLQDDKSLTFLYRAPKIQLGPLSLQAISSKYKFFLSISEEEAIKLAKMTKGYAYAYQVLGYIMYNKEAKKATNEIIDEYDQYLSQYVYEKVYSELSQNEKDIVNAIKSNQAVEVTSLRESLCKDTKSFSVYRNRLIRKGVLTSPSYGYIEFALPRFADFLKLV